ncbi:hypothetical protein, partial [Weissella confusa]|uniref:hypothetical protein n=1 Tax=Weissella confusa TaxID=1583 RepID=UPI001A7F0816
IQPPFKTFNPVQIKARAFFTDDLPKLQLLSHVRLSSVSLDAIPVHHSNENTASSSANVY